MLNPIRLLLFSSLFPSSQRPIHGIFVETRLRELVKTGQVQAKVVAIDALPLLPQTDLKWWCSAANALALCASLLANYPTREATRRHAETFSWDSTTQGQLDLFAKLVTGA